MQSQYSKIHFSTYIFFLFLRQNVSLNLELTDLTGLGGQGAPSGLLFSTFLMLGLWVFITAPSFIMCVLGIGTQDLMSLYQELDLLCRVPRPLNFEFLEFTYK